MKPNSALVCFPLFLLFAFAESRAVETNVPPEKESGCPGCAIDSTDLRSQDHGSLNTAGHYLVGGIVEKDVHNYKYVQLAQEAFFEYKKQLDSTEGFHITRIVKASEQIVSGILTRIDFYAKFVPSNSELLCHSEILQQPWLHVKDFKVSCDPKNQSREEKQIVGGAIEKDVHDYKYTQLAEESFEKYKKEVGSTVVHQILRIDRVTEQTVAGTITRIDFYASLDDSNVFFCHSEILEQLWLDVKEIKVSCDSENQTFIEEEQIPGGIIEKDVRDYRYTQLAEEALLKYKKEVGSTEDHQVLKIERVTEQPVAGRITRIDFDAKLVASNTVLSCHSEILEQLWLDIKDIKVSCNSKNQGPVVVAQIPGGVVDKDVFSYKYTQLAQEAFNKYKKEVGSTEDHQLIRIVKVSEQVVAGLLTTIDFDARLFPSYNVLSCHSEILEQLWLNVTDIKITCDTINQGPKEEVPILGGLVEKDVNDCKYTHLAEEAFSKYKKEIGSIECHQLLKIVKVTEQVVAGFLTQIDFNVRLGYSTDLFCRSKILEEPGVQQKHIDVNCDSINQEQT